MKVIFTLPGTLQAPGYTKAAPSYWPTTPLAYMEWFTPQGPVANKTHSMYKISKAFDSQGRPQGTIIPISNIRQSCMLFPIFPKNQRIPGDWHPNNILDKVESFLISNWLNKYSYQTLW
jgi:hypothetical protein